MKYLYTLIVVLFLIACTNTNNDNDQISDSTDEISQENETDNQNTNNSIVLTVSSSGQGQTSVDNVELDSRSTVYFYTNVLPDGRIPEVNEENINIIPIPSEDSFFIGWEIEGYDLELNTTLEIDQSTTVTAHFVDLSFFGLDTYEELFTGFNVNIDETINFKLNLKRYIDLVLINFNNDRIVNPIWAANEAGSFNIYFHFESWNGNPITAENIQGLISQYQEIINLWVASLREYDPQAPENLELKIFGFVFNEGVSVDDSFFEQYEGYPYVLNFTEGSESSPWITELVNSSTKINPYDNQVIDNRTDLPDTVTFYPENWNDFQHPDVINMYLKKAWFTLQCDGDCPAAGHGGVNYIRLFGEDMFDNETNRANMYVFTHELGHTFFLDDGYNCVKYPDGCEDQNPSIMFGGSGVITPFDHINIRLVWAQQRILNQN